MTLPRLSKLELKIMNALWDRGDLSVREVQENFPGKGRPAYTTIQTTMYRLEAKGAIERVRKIGNAHIFRALLSKTATERRLIDELLTLLGGRSQPVMAHLIESGNLTIDDIRSAEERLRDMTRRKKGRRGDA